MHLKNFWFYKKDLLSKGKKDPFEDFNNSGLDIEMNEIGFFKTWILDPKYKVVHFVHTF